MQIVLSITGVVGFILALVYLFGICPKDNQEPHENGYTYTDPNKDKDWRTTTKHGQSLPPTRRIAYVSKSDYIEIELRKTSVLLRTTYGKGVRRVINVNGKDLKLTHQRGLTKDGQQYLLGVFSTNQPVVIDGMQFAPFPYKEIQEIIRNNIKRDTAFNQRMRKQRAAFNKRYDNAL